MFIKGSENRFVSPHPHLYMAVKPLFRVKKCKRGFYILYTNIQNYYSDYR